MVLVTNFYSKGNEMQELNKSLLTLSMLSIFGLIWYQFGVLSALLVVAAFILLCMYLAYKCAMDTGETIIIIHPDVRKMMKDEEASLNSEIGAEQFQNLMSNYLSKYEYNPISQQELSNKLRERLKKRTNARVHKFKEQKEIELLNSWHDLEYRVEDNEQ